MEQTHYIIIFCIVFAFVYLCLLNKQEETQDNIETMIDSTNAPANLKLMRYIPEYPYIFGNRSNWYNALTPLPFYNPTRFYNNRLYYPYIQDYLNPREIYY